MGRDDASQLILLRFSGDITIKARGTRFQFVRRLLSNLRDALAPRAWRRASSSRTTACSSRSPDADGDARARARLRRAVALAGRAARADAARGDRRGRRRVLPRARRGQALRGARAARRRSRADRRLRARRRGRARRGAAAVRGRRRSRAAGADGRRRAARARDVPVLASASPSLGGLPLGVEGRAVALFSGGFDSAVAAWYLLQARRRARLRVLQPRRRDPPPGRAARRAHPRGPLELRRSPGVPRRRFRAGRGGSASADGEALLAGAAQAPAAARGGADRARRGAPSRS